MSISVVFLSFHKMFQVKENCYNYFQGGNFLNFEIQKIKIQNYFK